MTNLLLQELEDARKDLELSSNNREKYFHEVRIEVLKDLLLKVNKLKID